MMPTLSSLIAQKVVAETTYDTNDNNIDIMMTLDFHWIIQLTQ